MRRLLIGLALWGTALAEAREPGAGASFLRIDSSARAAALGGSFTALADDVHAIYYNPGGLASLFRRELGATHTEWLLGSKFDFLGYAQPTSFGTLGLGATRLTSGAIDARGADRSASGGFEASDTALTVGLGRRVSAATGAGANLKYIRSQLGQDSAQTFALDLGVVRRLEGRPASLGLSVLNLGKGLKYLDQTDPLPLTVAAGASYRLAGLVQLAVDLRHEPGARRTDFGFGSEYAVLPSFSLRAGYASVSPQAVSGSLLAGLGGGLGLKLSDYRADYTFSPFGALGNIQRVSVGARFK